MFSSLTLLIVVLSQWVGTQFKEEKRRLNEDLQAIFNGVSAKLAEQKIDSLIHSEALQVIAERDAIASDSISKRLLRTEKNERGVAIIQMHDNEAGHMERVPVDAIREKSKDDTQLQKMRFSIDIRSDDNLSSGEDLTRILDSVKGAVAGGHSVKTLPMPTPILVPVPGSSLSGTAVPKSTIEKDAASNKPSRAMVSAADTASGDIFRLRPTEGSSAKIAKELLSVLLLQTEFAADNASIQADPLMFLKAYTDSIHQKFPAVSVQIDNNDHPGPFAYTTDMVSGKTYHVNDHSSYLMKNIAPHVIFSALLLALTVISLWLSHRSLRQQYEFNIQKNEVISNISHELKTPVATTKAAIEALVDYDVIYDTDKAKKYLRMAGWEMNRLEMMISKVMNILQSEQGSHHLQKETIDLGILCQEIIDNLKPMLQQKGIQLITENLDQKMLIDADRAHILSVVYNLIENAIKYGKDTINISLNSSGNYAVFMVKDNGPGIAPAFKDKVFDNFFRIRDGNTHNVKGHGLGLSYARQIVRAHGGKLYLKTDQVSGATFVLNLPKADQI